MESTLIDVVENYYIEAAEIIIATGITINGYGWDYYINAAEIIVSTGD